MQKRGTYGRCSKVGRYQGYLAESRGFERNSGTCQEEERVHRAKHEPKSAWSWVKAAQTMTARSDDQVHCFCFLALASPIS